ncbi:MAG: putative sulfate exporter family transporter [Acidobacteriota bacterium]
MSLRRPSSLALLVLPGLSVAVAIALASRGLHGLLSEPLQRIVGEVIFAVLLGLVVGNVLPLGSLWRPGFRFAFRRVLRLAIVLLGARLVLGEILAIGGKALLLVAALMALALAVAHTLGRALGVPRKLATLIGVGTSVCGNSAISATAPVIGAHDEDVSFAIATNTLLGTAAVFAYPLLGRALGFDDATFGTWAGTAVNDTSQVVAAGFAFSEPAGEIATTVKLVRNALMGVVIVAVGFLHADGAAGGPTRFADRVRQSVPPFVLAFLAMAVARTLGWLDAASAGLGVDVVAGLAATSKFLILVALAGVGLGTRLAVLRATGPRPFVLGLATAAAVSLASLAAIAALGPAGG